MKHKIMTTQQAEFVDSSKKYNREIKRNIGVANSKTSDSIFHKIIGWTNSLHSHQYNIPQVSYSYATYYHISRMTCTTMYTLLITTYFC